MRYYLLLFLGFVLVRYGSAQCMIDSVFIQSILIDPTGAGNDYDTNGDGVVNSQDEYVEICNMAVSAARDISGWQLGDDDSGAFPDFIFPDNSILASGACILIINDYCPASSPPDTCETPEGILSMNLMGALLGNSGDVITLADSSGVNSCSVVYGTMTCGDVDPLDIPPFSAADCDSWGADADGCPLLMEGDSCSYLPMALPVTFGYFSARGDIDGVLLEWSTEMEINNDYFELEWRSAFTDGYRVIERAPGSGTSAEPRHYSYKHEEPAHGVNYYRVRQVDFDGRFSYSPVRSASFRKFTDARLSPSLFTDGVRLLGIEAKADVSVFDLQGRLYLHRAGLSEGDVIDLYQLPKGAYMARIQIDGHLVFRRIIKI